MKDFLTILLVIISCFEGFMITPFGLWWTMNDLDNGNPCYGIIIAFLLAIPGVIIAEVLKSGVI